MRVLLTGASGFIGRIANTYLSEEHEVLCLSRSNSPDLDNQIICDLGDFHFAQKQIIDFNPETIIHLGWEGIPNFSFEISRKNLYSSINFINWALDNTNCKKLVISGTCLEYGEREGLCNEDHEPQVKNYLTWAKLSLYHFANLKTKMNNTSLIWLRLFYIYGPTQREGSLIPTLIKAFIEEKPLNIKNPFNKNDYVFNEDLGDLFSNIVASKDISGVFNIGSGQTTSVYEISRIVENIVKNSSQISDRLMEIDKKDLSISNFYADTNKTEKYLHWSPKTKILEGISRYL